jgi:L-histidine Nalpha-methyltransferase
MQALEEASGLAEDVRQGLMAPAGRKQLSCRFLYDEVGSALFEAITYLPEYGLTRAEERILHAAARPVMEMAGRCRVAELGSGSGRKTRLLLEHGVVSAYHPIDVSLSALAQCEAALADVAPVEVIHRDYLSGLDEVNRRRAGGERLLLLFLGSTIGNFSPAEARAFLSQVRGKLHHGDLLLLGADLVKSAAVLIPAYDDPAGVTAAFNRNLLARVNRELNGEFDLRQFAHEARWNAAAQRVEMHLRSTCRQRVRIHDLGLWICLEEGETIWTESSYKFKKSDLEALAGEAGFREVTHWIDAEWGFTELLLES